ncbi:MAG: uracil-DNA glycosylase [Candidatus Eremiobacteraeota bacterium]|nr:uracil-DNA glycosylase [Candidatus Eremiobacteraeota bacterium]MBV8282210.1 uracil-DNA glycosylase [Candidatus Eremiobacteraeota bacterium]
MTLARVRDRIVACRRCPELRRYCAEIARVRKREFAHDIYWGKPVPSIGDSDARILIVGLAPAAHGGNRTGRMFTGDGSAAWLAPALYQAGLATQPTSERRDDGFALIGAFMTAALRCAPPQNKPTKKQLAACADHMRAELDLLPEVRVVVGLGKIGFDIAYDRLRERGYATQSGRRPRFAHGAEYVLAAKGKRDITLLGSYHPGRQNTNTGRLTLPMLRSVFKRAHALAANDSIVRTIPSRRRASAARVQPL